MPPLNADVAQAAQNCSQGSPVYLVALVGLNDGPASMPAWRQIPGPPNHLSVVVKETVFMWLRAHSRATWQPHLIASPCLDDGSASMQALCATPGPSHMSQSAGHKRCTTPFSCCERNSIHIAQSSKQSPEGSLIHLIAFLGPADGPVCMQLQQSSMAARHGAMTSS